MKKRKVEEGRSKTEVRKKDEQGGRGGTGG